ncbi:DUF1259 domain-containing protein [Streptomyces gobiensis]|uniref:DUF1259 domain-containing protein n=1 Tax=Streptomyces gobiensis TaxID=2875706 RepID=UPI001E340602|nr:DUF1259 domain-containing protein [Streptomyces gobiensis]UGY92892.1 DUF1259 domain-containing protein [Streptomyces gobiensis]
MNEDRQQGTQAGATTGRRGLLAAVALAPVLAGAGAGATAARAEPSGGVRAGGRGVTDPVPTTIEDWKGVAEALGRRGDMRRGVIYHTAFPRGDLHVVCHGITITPALALSSHVAFVRYTDGSTLLMGDLVVAEDELQQVSSALHAHGIAQTAIHKHLLAQEPDVWWTHIHAHGHDPVALARGLRAALGRTGTPPAEPPTSPPPVDLDTAGIDAALGVKGFEEDGIYKCLFIRRETIIDDHRALPPGMGSTSGFIFRPLGGGRAAVHGDFAMVAGEVQAVLTTLRRGGISLATLHSHHLMEEPRLFFVHVWAVDDAVSIARALRPAVTATNVTPSG